MGKVHARPKASPNAMQRSPHGIMGAGSISFTDPHTQGKYKSYDLIDIQPTSATSFTWTAIDNQIASAAPSQKQSIVLMNLCSGPPTGTEFQQVPQWLVNAGAVAYMVLNTNHDASFYQFLPWDPVFKTYAHAFVAAMGARYDGQLASTTMGGIGSATEWHLPDPDSMTGLYPDGSDLATAAALWTQAAKDMIAAYGAAFTKTPFIGAIAPPFAGSTGNTALQTVVDWAVANYGSRFGVENWGLNALSNNGYLPNSIIQSLSATNPVGFQMAGSSIGGGGAPLHGTLRQAMDAGVALGAQYLQVYGQDIVAINYPDLDSVFSRLTPPPHPDSATSYVPPVGIPAPSFGINEVAGARTHYIDNTAPGATDTANPNGSPTTPRLTIPTTLAAGSVVEVHGGPYNAASPSTAFKPAVNGWVGTADSPIFIRGTNSTTRPVISDTSLAYNFILGAAYVIVENIDFLRPHIEIRQTTNHFCFRYCDFHGVVENPTVGTNNGNIISLWSDSSGTITQFEEDIVLYQNTIHDNAWPPTYENGAQGVMIQNGSKNVWVLENQIYNNGEDNIQIYLAPLSPPRQTTPAQFIYIGGNTLYDTSGKMENAVDIKQCNDVVVSSNDCYGYRNTYASDGTAIVVNNDTPSDNIWVINNHIHDSTTGVRNQSSGHLYVIGNLIENINHESGQTFVGFSHFGTAIYMDSGQSDPYVRELHAINNTIYHADQGIVLRNVLNGYLENNIVGDLNTNTGSTVWSIARNTSTGAMYLKNNLLYRSDATAPIVHQSSDYTATSWDAAFPSQGSADTAGDPLYTSAGAWTLQAGSPAKDSGIVSDVFATFFALYGISIATDRNGVKRPQNAVWNRGAYETL